MGTKKSFVKGLAAGAVLGAVAAMIHSMQDKDEKAKEVRETANRIKDAVAEHAKTLGKLSKSAYSKIVDTTVAEYRGVKALSEDELKELSGELKGGWKDIELLLKSTAKKMLAKKPTAAPKKAVVKKKRA